MVQPINYMGMIPQPDLARSLASGLQLGSGIREMQQQRVAAEQAQAARQQLASDVEAARADGSQQAWLGMIAKYPQFREAFGDVRKGLGEEQVKSEFFGGFEVSNALEANQPLVAAERLRTIIAAKENSGQDARLHKQALERIEAGDTKRAQSGINEILSVLDPERFEKTVNAKTTAAQAPLKLRQEIAAADKAEVEAKVKMETATDDIAKAKAARELEQAKAKKESIEAKYADQVAKDAIKKRAADLGLTTAQTNQALATTRKLGTETQKAVLELEALKATGGRDPAKAFDQEEKLRREFQTRTKTYQEVNQTYQTLQASAKSGTGAGDIALITGFMKMLDPGSVVRETEFATARDTAGLFARLENSLKKAEDGQFLQPKQRNEYVALAREYFNAAQKRADEDKKALGIVVKNYKLNPENVFGAEQAPPPPLPTSATVGGQTYQRPASFTDAQWSDYLKANGVIQ
jgi:hypothetical protein